MAGVIERTPASSPDSSVSAESSVSPVGYALIHSSLLPKGWLVACWSDDKAVAVSPGARKDVQSLRQWASPSPKEAVLRAMLVLD